MTTSCTSRTTRDACRPTFSLSKTIRTVIPGAVLELNEHGDIAWGCCMWNKPESKACWYCGRPRRKAYILPTREEYEVALSGYGRIGANAVRWNLPDSSP